MCEHDPVITLGRRTRPEHLLLQPDVLAERGIEVCHATRGGEATYLGPGQLVGYPVVRLRRGVLAHVEGMASAVIAVLKGLGIDGEWRRTLPGVWVGAAKICAFGVQVRHGVSIHGLALNVSTDLQAFSSIVPCGLRDARVTSVAQVLGANPPALPELAEQLARSLAGSLHLDVCEQSRPWPADWEEESEERLPGIQDRRPDGAADHEEFADMTADRSAASNCKTENRTDNMDRA
jgi:lipoyl(octanoyl) transferase